VGGAPKPRRRRSLIAQPRGRHVARGGGPLRSESGRRGGTAWRTPPFIVARLRHSERISLIPPHGRLLGLSRKGDPVASGKEITHPAADVSIAIGAEVANVHTITLRFKKVDGGDVDVVTPFWLAVFTDATATAYATTGGSTGVAIGTDGALLAVVAKKLFHSSTEADGDWDGTWTDTGTEQVALGVILPTGRLVMSAAFANA
jgi:hypothetical protein